MATSAADLTTKIGYHLATPISSSGTRWTTTQVYSLLNDAQREVIDELYTNRCWKLLRELQKDATYTLTGSTSYNVYTVIGSSTDYYKYVNGRVGNFRLNSVTIEDEDRITSTGENLAGTEFPWICFYGYDSTTNHGNLPVIKIRPSALTETLYFRYLKTPPTMADASGQTPAVTSCLTTECDNALIFWVCAMCWGGDRNSESYSRYWGHFRTKMDALIAEYGEPAFNDVLYLPVS